MVLPCLHRYAYRHEKKMQLSEVCFQEVKRVMRQRAISVDLIPEVEDSCLEDLAANCFDKTQKGEEMECLQQHLEELSNGKLVRLIKHDLLDQISYFRLQKCCYNIH